MSLLKATSIRKGYPGVTALAGVDFGLDAGEVHALLGENGAGKSTLMKVIAGSVRPDSGEIAVDGRPLPLSSPQASRTGGVATVFQELSLVPSLSVGENVLLGHWPTGRSRTVAWTRLYDEADRRLRRLGVQVDVRTPVRSLGMADRQLVEIAKSLYAEVRVLLLDEPTSALSRPEAQRLFGIVRELQSDGVGIVYVSHMLSEMLEIADRITVLRDGEVVATVLPSDVTETDLARLMVGHPPGSLAVDTPGQPFPRPRVDAYDADVSVHSRPTRPDASVHSRPTRPDASVHSRPGEGRPGRVGGRGEVALRVRWDGVGLELRRGEIVAVFGLVGAGRTRLARTLFGLEAGADGDVEVLGRTVRIGSPVDAIDAGLGYLGEDRAAGVVPRMTVAQNITLGSLRTLGRGPLVDFGREREIARRYVDELDIRVPSVDHPAGTLSGGNQQKVVLARWLCSGSRVLILDDPMRGIDVGAKAEIVRLLRRLAGAGIAILYLTSEIKEAKELADRVLVMAGGRVVRTFPPGAPDDEIVAAAGGGRRD